MATNNAYEQLVIELTNRARLDPLGEAARYGIDLNEGLAANTISSTPKQPLASNAALTTAARNHVNWMFANQLFQHPETVGSTGFTGSDPPSRMVAAGYGAAGTFFWAENISLFQTSGTLDPISAIYSQWQGLFVDSTVNGRGHRVNIMNPTYVELGVGYGQSTFQGFNADLITQDFGAISSRTNYLTGVVYNDTTVADGFYTPGEGLNAVSVSIAGGSSAATAQAGGYDIVGQTGTKTVTFSGGGLATAVTVIVDLPGGNVKLDLVNDSLVRSSASNTTLSTGARDLTLLGSAVTGTGNALNNLITGDAANNVLSGMAGNDTLVGGAGTNSLVGGTGWDTANYSIASASATVVHNANGTWTISGPGFSDTLTDVEVAHFTNGDRILASTSFSASAAAINNFGQAQGWSSNDTYHRVLADVNGDLKADIVGFGQAGSWVSLATSGGNFGAATLNLSNFGQAQGWSGDTAFHRVLADVNGDHKADIVGFGQAGTWVALATSGGNFASATFSLSNFGAAQGWGNDTTYHREVADVNGDGLADIVGFGQIGVYVALATGNGQFGPAMLQLANFAPGAGGWSSDNTFHREVADINGDGMADIVGFGQGGVFVSLATGGGHFGASNLAVANFGQAQGWSTQDSNPRHLADVNGDGLADIVGFGQSNVFVAFSTGDGHFTPAIASIANYAAGAGGWTSNTAFPRLTGDITGDGHADIVGFGAAGTLSSFLLL